MSHYPDTATFTTLTGGGIDPDTGYPLPGTATSVTLTGRYDVSVKDFLQRVNDAQSFTPVFVFYMPLDQPNVPVNTVLSVQDSSSGLTFTGTVQMFNKGKFNAYALCSNS